jgi:hypothetical protein
MDIPAKPRVHRMSWHRVGVGFHSDARSCSAEENGSVLSLRASRTFHRTVGGSCRNVVHVRFGWPYFGVRADVRMLASSGEPASFRGFCNAGVNTLMLLGADARLVLLFSPTACRRSLSTAGG